MGKCRNTVFIFITSFVVSVCGLVKLDYFRQCSDHPKTPIYFANTRITETGVNEIKVFGDVILGMPVTSPAVLQCSVKRCPSKEKEALCVLVYEFTEKNFCDYLNDEKSFFRVFMSNTNMKQTCPIPSGNYSINGAQVIPKDEKFSMSTFVGYWKGKCIGKQKNEVVCCGEAGFLVTLDDDRKRRKQK